MTPTPLFRSAEAQASRALSAPLERISIAVDLEAEYPKLTEAGASSDAAEHLLLASCAHLAAAGRVERSVRPRRPSQTSAGGREHKCEPRRPLCLDHAE